MTQAIERDLSLLLGCSAEHDVLRGAFPGAVVGTDEAAVVARDLALVEAVADLVLARDEGRRTPLDLLEALRTPLEDDLPA